MRLFALTTCCGLLLLSLGAAEPADAGAGSGEGDGLARPDLVTEMAARLIYEQAAEHPRAEAFLREIAVELGAGKLRLDEARELLAIVDQLGLFEQAAVTVAPPRTAGAGPVDAADAPPQGGPAIDPVDRLNTILDGPETRSTEPSTDTAAETVTEGDPLAVRPTVPRGRELPPMETPEWSDIGPAGTVRSATEGKRPGSWYVMIASDVADDFTVGQNFVVRDAEGALVRGTIVKAQGKLVVGSLLEATWRDDDRRVPDGSEVMVQRRADVMK